ncbi:MAG TPA: peptidoglycan -binding protein, partial [Alphaproteobacteria bacterium]|nr:peptidoglycan -binding protein [Alphaproteobacteria bacterium]
SRLNQQVSELADLLGLEQLTNEELRANIADLGLQLQTSTKDREELNRQLFLALEQQDNLGGDIASLQRLNEVSDAERKDLDLRLAAALAALKAEEAALLASRDETATSRSALVEQTKLSTVAQRQVTLLNQQIAALRIQLNSIQAALDATEADVAKKNVQIVDLGRRLNVALAQKVGELSRYRSEFFGRLRASLSGRSAVSIEGDRFVIQSGVLFGSASARLDPAGEAQLNDLAQLLLDISADIPKDIRWVLRIDGHTDKRPINTPQFPSNWELSVARAISVVRYLVDRGVSPHRLMAAGFGEFQPLVDRDSDDAYKSNRRIELKLTER